jgi:16S rRNA (guanine1516-N2)-methyltransferase
LNQNKPPIAVISMDAALAPYAEALANSLSLPFWGIAESRVLPAGVWLLTVSEEGLAMRQSTSGPVKVDFVGGKMGFRRQRQEPTPDLVKAVRVRPGIYPQVWDLTAGLGQDAFILARHGCCVTMFERHPLVHRLLADGLERARRFALGEGDEKGDEKLQRIMDRLTLVLADSIRVLSALSEEERPDVIYIDSMFPERTKSAKVKKGMQLFQEIVGKDPDAEQLLNLALERARYRVVVKRPRRAPALTAPTLSIAGKSVRFDTYVLTPWIKD